MFSLIACVGKNRELGKKGELIFHIKEDMKFFKETTMGHKVVMGRKTWESLPFKLPGRENIVISSRDFDGPDKIVHDISEFASSNKDSDEEIFVIGGGRIYAEFLPYTKKLYLTEADASDEAADVYFPEFDETKFEKTVIKEGKDHDLAFSVCLYQLK